MNGILSASSRFRNNFPVIVAVCCLASFPVYGTDIPKQPAPHMSHETRMNLVRAFEADLVYIRTSFPMGTKGLTLKEGALSPGGIELQQMLTMWGPAVKAGDQARISSIEFKGNAIHFEINGGPIKKQKWYQRISVGGAGGETPIAPTDAGANPRGSYVDLVFSNYIPELDPAQLKELLRPVFDFNSKSAQEAYLETVPPKAKEAITNHQVLVGMNREMVICAKGRPAQKVREKEDDVEHEDWVYGEPPHDVDFVRIVGDEVVRVETMKVNGQKTVRTAREVDLRPKGDEDASSGVKPGDRPNSAPTLRRPGEEMPTHSSDSPSSSRPLPPTAPTSLIAQR